MEQGNVDKASLGPMKRFREGPSETGSGKKFSPRVRKRQLAFPRQILFPANRPTLKLTKSIPLSQFSAPSSIVPSLVSLEWNIFLSGTKGDR